MIISNILNKISQTLFLFTDFVFRPKENTCDMLRAQCYLLLMAGCVLIVIFIYMNF